MASKRMHNWGVGLVNGVHVNKRMVTRGVRSAVRDLAMQGAELGRIHRMTAKEKQKFSLQKHKELEAKVLEDHGVIAWLKFKAGHIKQDKLRARLKADHEAAVRRANGV